MKSKAKVLLVAALLTCGCATSNSVDPGNDVGGGGAGDLGPRDLGPADLSAADRAMRDASPADLASRPADLAAADLAPRPPDLAPVCAHPAGSSCGVAPECGCSGGTSCTITDDTSGATSCIQPGSTPNYSVCTGSGAGQCQAGSTCVDGVCEPYCATGTDCSGGYRACEQVQNSSGASIPGFLTCSQYCDPTSPQSTAAPYAGCGPTVSCLPATNGITACLAPTTASGTDGAPCGDSLFNPKNPVQSDCAPGYGCVNVGIGGLLNVFECERFCHVGHDEDCASLNSDAGTYSCTSFNPSLYAGPVEIGACTAN